MPFGAYCEVHDEPRISNTETSRTTPAIALIPTGNAQSGYFFMSLNTGKGSAGENGGRNSQRQMKSLPRFTPLQLVKTVDFQFSWNRQHNHPIEPFDYSVHEHLIPAPKGVNVLQPVTHEEHNVDNISIDNNKNTDADTEQDQDQDQDHPTNKNDDAQEQDQDLTIENENMPDNGQMETAQASDSDDDDVNDVDDDEDQGAPQLENRGVPEEEAKEQESRTRRPTKQRRRRRRQTRLENCPTLSQYERKQEGFKSPLQHARKEYSGKICFRQHQNIQTNSSKTEIDQRYPQSHDGHKSMLCTIRHKSWS